MINNAYVYAIEVAGIIRYVGKGTGKRAWAHVRHANNLIKKQKISANNFYQQLTKAILSEASIDVQILKSNLSEEDAYYFEAVEISKTGLGQLWNTFSGGVGSTSADIKRLFERPGHLERVVAGIRATWADQENRKQRIAAIKAARSTPEARARSSEHMRAVRAEKSWSLKGVKRKKVSQEGRKVLSDAAKRRAQRPDERKRRQELGRRPENIERLKMIGKLGDPLVIAKAREGTARAWNDPIKQARMREGLKQRWVGP